MAVAGPVTELSGFNIGFYDEIQIDYSGTLTDVYTYFKETILIATLTLTYSASNKKSLISTVKT